MKMRFYTTLFFGLLANLTTPAFAQDTRHVTEPKFPKTCAVLRAPLRSSVDGPAVGPTAAEQNQESGSETDSLTRELNKCPKNQAVELALGDDSSLNSFLLNPIEVPSGVSLIIDGGVTVYASRDPEHYQDTNPKTNPGGKIICGTTGPYPPVRGCIGLLTFSSNSGLYGYGVIDGQGNRTLLTGSNAGKKTWWNLTTDKKGTDDEQASPKMVVFGSPNEKADNFEMYKVTIRNPPYHTVNLSGNGITVWGVKIQAPWNLGNTDGFDTDGSNITFYDTTVANGDQQIVLNLGITNVTVDRFQGYSKGGITILANGTPETPVKNILVQNAYLTGDVASLMGTTVNGVSEAALKQQYGIKSYTQALPNATNEIKGIQINTNLNVSRESQPGAVVQNVTFRSVCMQDIVRPISLGPVVPFTSDQSLPSVQGLTFQDIHVLPPTSQFPPMKKGQPVTDPAIGSYPYLVNFEAFAPNYVVGVTFDNVVFDDLVSGDSSVGEILAEGTSIATKNNVYPPVLNQLAATKSESRTIGRTKLILSANTYTSTASVSTPWQAYPCSATRLPFMVGELYASVGDSGDATNLAQTDLPPGGTITLNAVVQPAMSQTTLFIADIYGSDPGLVAVGAPALTNRVRFYEGASLIGSASLAANGTLASLEVTGIRPGTHVYRAEYPGDAHYGRMSFGSVTVRAGQAAAPAQ